MFQVRLSGDSEPFSCDPGSGQNLIPSS
jgi:hypothetical protein